MVPAMTAAPLVGAPDWKRWPGPALGLAIIAGSVTGAWLAAAPGGRSLSLLMSDNVLTNGVNGVEIGAIAAILTFLRPANRVGWLLMYAAAVNGVAILGEGWALASYQLGLPGRTLMAWLGSWIWVTALILGATVLPAIYPTGRAVGDFGRWVVRIGWTASLVAGVALACLDDVYRAAVPGHRVGTNPISHGQFRQVFMGVAAAAAACGVALVVVTLVWTVRRLRRASSPEREQLAWLLVSVVPSIVLGLFAPPPVRFGVNLLTSAALVVGIVRYRLFDIKLVLRSGLLYGLLLALALAAYFAVVELVALVAPGGIAPHAFAAAAVALLVGPAYHRLAQAVGRLVYGDRADPVRALGRVNAGAGAGPAGVADLTAMVAAVADSVHSPHVVVRSATGELVAESGQALGHSTYEVALEHGGVALGSLSVAWRTPADKLSATDRRLVDALAGPVALALHATRLAGDLEESRSRVIAVRERERRRLRNDLHDGLGPSLSGIALGIEAAQRGDGTRVREILEVLHTEVNGLVGEVRNLIDDLGPAGLDRGELVVALRSHAEAVNALGELAVTIDADSLPELDEAVEVALHRVAAEALTNVVRHAQAGNAWLRVRNTPTGVCLLVEDDGRGCDGTADGVGRSSMRERIASVGGTLDLFTRPGGGTALVAHVPRTGADHG